jgi:hypothetical protein
VYSVALIFRNKKLCLCIGADASYQVHWSLQRSTPSVPYYKIQCVASQLDSLAAKRALHWRLLHFTTTSSSPSLSPSYILQQRDNYYLTLLNKLISSCCRPHSSQQGCREYILPSDTYISTGFSNRYKTRNSAREMPSSWM